MVLTRRDIFAGLLASVAAPAVIRTPDLLMPVRARHRIRMSGHVLYNPSGLSFEDHADDGAAPTLEESYQAIIDVVNRPRRDGNFIEEPARAKLARRNVLGGLFVSIAAPYVVRNSGILMPVRNRLRTPEEITEWLRQDNMRKQEAAVREIERLRALHPETLRFRDFDKYPPALAEVIEWRREMKWMTEQRMSISLTGDGMNRIHAMSDAEDRYEAMGLL